MPLRRFLAGYRVTRTKRLRGGRIQVHLAADARPFRVVILRLEEYLARVERVFTPARGGGAETI